MLLVMKMVVAGEHVSHAHGPPNKRSCCVIMYITDQLQ